MAEAVIRRLPPNALFTSGVRNANGSLTVTVSVFPAPVPPDAAEQAIVVPAEFVQVVLTAPLALAVLLGADLRRDRGRVGRGVGAVAGRLADRVVELDPGEEEPAEVDGDDQEEQEDWKDEGELDEGLARRSGGAARGPAGRRSGCGRTSGEA